MKTRFTAETGIEIEKQDGHGWRHVDTNDGQRRCVGPIYQSKAELMADHEDYLKRAGWMPEPAGSESPTIDTQPTAGPWIAEHDLDGGFEIQAPNRGHNGNTLVICRRNPHSDRAGEMAANAELLAAAPKMLAALQAVDRLIKEALPKFNWGASALDANAIQLLNEVPCQVGAAIKAAKGIPT